MKRAEVHMYFHPTLVGGWMSRAAFKNGRVFERCPVLVTPSLTHSNSLVEEFVEVMKQLINVFHLSYV